MESLAHELFHGVQNEHGQKLSTILSEIEAYVFGVGFTYIWGQQNEQGCSLNNIEGRSNAHGTKYHKAMQYLTFEAFSYEMLNQAVTNFKEGSLSNMPGRYNSFAEPSTAINNSILPQYYDPALTQIDYHSK